MTLILALANKDYVVQISDRRLTADGVLVDDESNKSSVIFCLNGRVACGFTGLAKAGRFVTHRWLLDTLHESAPPDFTIGETLQRLTVAATKTFLTHPDLRHVPGAGKRLALMFSGFVNHDGALRPGCAVISNFHNFAGNTAYDEAQDSFVGNYQTAKIGEPNPTLVQRIGSWRAMTYEHESTLREMLARGLPSQALVGKAVELVREIADRPKSLDLIGKQLTAVVIPSSLDEVIESGYYSDRVKPETFMPSQVHLFPGQHMTIDEISIRPVDIATPPMSVPKVGRNMPCPCGVGRKYKHCHGRKLVTRKAGLAPAD